VYDGPDASSRTITQTLRRSSVTISTFSRSITGSSLRTTS
jgi:hypothetical protein